MLVHEPWASIAGLRHGFLPGRAEPPITVRFPRQVHGTVVVTANERHRPEADGLATATSGTAVGVVTADCVPILVVASRRHVAAAVHAGWRGAAAGIARAAVAHLRDAFGVEPDDLEACLGPAIGPCCYEVGPEVRAAFRRASGDVTEAAWHRRGDRETLDLRTAVAALLRDAGVRRVAPLGPCTRCDARYCSYRREGTAAGRQVSFIGWA